MRDGAAAFSNCGASDSGWAGVYTPKWTSTTYTLLLLCAFGRRAGNRAAGQAARLLLDAGPAEQMPDGGWNCQRFRGATHSVAAYTISALEGLLEYEASGGGSAKRTREPRERAHEFLRAHQMFRSHRTGEVIDQRVTRFSFPPQWHYDVLRGLDYVAGANAPRDQRPAASIDLVKMHRDSDETWAAKHTPGRYQFVMERLGEPAGGILFEPCACCAGGVGRMLFFEADEG